MLLCMLRARYSARTVPALKKETLISAKRPEGYILKDCLSLGVWAQLGRVSWRTIMLPGTAPCRSRLSRASRTAWSGNCAVRKRRPHKDYTGTNVPDSKTASIAGAEMNVLWIRHVIAARRRSSSWRASTPGTGAAMRSSAKRASLKALSASTPVKARGPPPPIFKSCKTPLTSNSVSRRYSAVTSVRFLPSPTRRYKRREERDSLPLVSRCNLWRLVCVEATEPQGRNRLGVWL
jgi:hypothetical protein